MKRHQSSSKDLSSVSYRGRPYIVQPRLQLPTKSTSISEQEHRQSIPTLDTAPLRTIPLAKGRYSRNRYRVYRKYQPRKKRVHRLLIGMCLVLIIATIGLGQTNGQGGAVLADILRATLGPTITAQIESWYLGTADLAHQAQYKLQGQQAAAPWQVSNMTPAPISSTPSGHTMPTFAPMSLTPLSPLISPALPGEGTWITQNFSTPTATIPSLPIIAKTFYRPDPVRPYAVITMLQFDTRFVQLHMLAGTDEPGGPLGVHGSGVIPQADQQALLAAFNGGFKYADGQYGMTVNGVTYVPPKQNVATIALTREGKIILGSWGTDSRLVASNPDLVAWRQNAALLIDQGVINPLTSDGAAWGGTILNSTYTWRSGLGITASGDLVYAAGNSLSARTLGRALQAAGVVMAMQTDINPFWVRAFLYTRANGNLSATKLNLYMQGTGYEYLNGMQRDFFYMTYKTPPVLPSSHRQRLVSP